MYQCISNWQALHNRNHPLWMARRCEQLWSNRHSPLILYFEVVNSNININNGVKQGGVLSPALFDIYLDELFQSLRRSGSNCYVGNAFSETVVHADDIALNCSTRRSLNNMLDICCDVSIEYNLSFNADKSNLVVYPCKSNHRIAVKIVYWARIMCEAYDRCREWFQS